jgi:hypothetical protein
LQAGGRRFDPVNLHHVLGNAKPKSALGFIEGGDFGLVFYDHWLFLFFNNLEEVVKNLSVGPGVFVMNAVGKTGGL